MSVLPTDEELRSLFSSVQRIAILGAKDVPSQPVDRVGRYLIGEGFDVLPVHPKRETVWNRKVTSSVAQITVPLDMVVLFRAGKFCAEHAREVLSLSHLPKCFWMQEGIVSEEARRLLEPKGILVVEDACVMVEHSRLYKVVAPVDDSSVFVCKMCGECCKGKGGIVVSPTDLIRITSALGISEELFREQYGEIRGGKLQIRTGEDGACIFFREGKGCAVHAGKPDVCRAWPFFRGNIVDSESLAMAKEFCPGIVKEATHEQFAREGIAYLKKHHLLGSDTEKGGWAVFLD